MPRFTDRSDRCCSSIVGRFLFLFSFFSFPPSSNIEFLFIVKRRESSFLQFVHRDAVSSDYLNYSIPTDRFGCFDRKNTSNSPIRSLLSFTADQLFSNSFDHGADTGRAFAFLQNYSHNWDNKSYFLPYLFSAPKRDDKSREPRLTPRGDR